jgi:choline transport protein
MVNAPIIFLQTSCIIPQAILLYRGRDRVLPKWYFSHGRYGFATNAVAVAWVCFLNILYWPITSQHMSYVSVMCTGLVGFVLVLWFTSKRKTFRGPKVGYELLEERRIAAMHDGVIVTEGEARDSTGFQSGNGVIKAAEP